MSLHLLDSWSIVIALNIFSLVMSVLLSAYAIRFRPNRKAVSFAVLMGIFAVWSLLKLILILNPTLSFLKITSVFIFTISSFTPSIILYIVIIHTRYPKWFRKDHIKYLFFIPIIQAFLSLTNEFHHLFIKGYSIVDPGILTFFRYEPGPVNFIFPIYLYSTIGLSLIILLRNLFSGSKFFNIQVMFLFIGIALPAINDILFMFGFSFIQGYRLTPEFFIFGNIFFAWALFGYRFLDLKPIARNSIVQSMDEIIIVINNKGLLTDLNSSGEVFFKLKLDEVIGKPSFTVFENYSELTDILKSTSVSDEICLVQHSKKNYFIVKQSFAEYFYDKPLVQILILRNITQRKNAEIDLKKYTLELEKSNALKDQTFQIIANNIRNPFQGLIGYSDFALHDFDKLNIEKIKHIIELMNETSKKGYNLLENILEWSRLQTETLDFKPGFSSLSKIAIEAVAAKADQSAVKNITITNNILDDFKIFADSNMIYSVFRNLLSNSIKFNKIDGTITVNSSVNLEEKKVIVEIADSGIGISQEVLSSVFKLKNKSSGSPSEPSNGLGLLLCREFVEKNGGTIHIESEAGSGTTVFFSVPFLADNELVGIQNKTVSDEGLPNGNPSKYALPQAHWKSILSRLIFLLEEEKVYKNQNLTINEFAALLNTNRTYVSQIINDTFQTNFCSLINDYRIKEAELMLAENNKKLKMETIAIESGFRSRSAFYAAFKKKIGKTPTEFIS